jgi:O-antigen ligase/polysaccharide polymerase Wzy-like membrane protein
VSAWLARWYGLLAVAVVSLTQLFFSLHKGGYFPDQWYWGASAIAIALVGAALVPGYFSSLRRGQWVLLGTLLALTAIVAASISWSISPVLSVLEASRTAMYVGAFLLLLPAAARWGWLIADATVFGALLPPALFGLAQKIYPTAVVYSGFATLETDPKASSTVGYHPTFGMMCAMGALLAVARIGSFRSLRSTPLRGLYSATGVIFLVALYFSFSRGALLAFAAGAVVLLALAKHRFEVLGNLAITVLPALWVISQARELPGLVTRPVSEEVMKADGLALIAPLLTGVLLALAAQVVFSLLVRAAEGYMPDGARHVASIVGTTLAVVVVAGGFFFGWAKFQEFGGVEELRSRITGSDTELEAEAIATDQTKRFTSMSAANRIALWKIAWATFREHPLTGTGGDTYQVVYQEKSFEGVRAAQSPVLHPHSMWMSLLSDTGIFALLAFGAFCIGSLALTCYNAFSKTRSRTSRALIAGSAAAATAYLVSSSIDWNWYIPASTLPFFALAAVAVGTTQQRGHKERPISAARKSLH